MSNEVIKEFLLLGFWQDSADDGYPHPRELVDLAWNAKERADVCYYLRNGVCAVTYLGHSYCRFPDGPAQEEMGCREFTDGKWLWPEALPIYVENYSVRLPKRFVVHAKNNIVQDDADLQNEDFTKWGRNADFWRKWAIQYIACKSRARKSIFYSILWKSGFVGTL